MWPRHVLVHAKVGNAFATYQEYRSHACMSSEVLTTAIIVPNTQDLMHDVTISQDVMARQAESSMTLAETPYTVSARPTLAARPAMHNFLGIRLEYN